jgi:hypothetical protein
MAGFWNNTYGFLSNVGTLRAQVGLWVAYVVGTLLVLAVPIALISRALRSSATATAADATDATDVKSDAWTQFQSAKPAAVLGSFACCVLFALIIVLVARWSLYATKKYKPFAAFGGADLFLGADLFQR